MYTYSYLNDQEINNCHPLPLAFNPCGKCTYQGIFTVLNHRFFNQMGFFSDIWAIWIPTIVLGVENVAHEPNLVGNVAPEPSFEEKMLKESRRQCLKMEKLIQQEPHSCCDGENGLWFPHIDTCGPWYFTLIKATNVHHWVWTVVKLRRWVTAIWFRILSLPRLLAAKTNLH